MEPFVKIVNGLTAFSDVFRLGSKNVTKRCLVPKCCLQYPFEGTTHGA